MAQQEPRLLQRKLQVLGGFKLCDVAGTEIKLPTRQDRGLLAYLALSTRRPQRDSLASLVWEDRELEQARHSLTGALRTLRNALGDVIVPNSDPLACDLRSIEVDAVLFKHAATQSSVELLAMAETLYGGDLLEGLELRSTSFQEWLRMERQHYRDLAVDALGRLIVIRQAAQEFDKARESARRVLELDELREDAHRFLIREHLRQGNRWAALKQAERCQSVLKSANVVPEPETARAFAELRGNASQRPGEPAHATADNAPPLPDNPSIAVLPFHNLSDSPEYQYFSDGITEDITTELSRFRNLFVIARNSSFAFKGRSDKAQEIGRALGVAHLVEGSVRRMADRVRITAQLVEATSGMHIWADKYDRTIEEIFAVQDEVVQSIVVAVAGRVDDTRLRQARRKPTGSMMAYDLLLRGYEYLRRNYYDIDAHATGAAMEARELLERALALDPLLARAHGGIAWTHVYEWFYSAAREDLEKGVVRAEQAVRLDDTDSLTHAVLGYLYTWRSKGDHDRARSHLEAALSLNPNDADAMLFMGIYLVFAGRPAEAITWMEKAMRLNPLHPVQYSVELGRALYQSQKFEAALVTFRKVDNTAYWVRGYIVTCLSQLGRIEEARAEAKLFMQDVAAAVRLPNRTTPSADTSLTWIILAEADMFEREEDRELFLEGYRMAGLSV